MQLEAVNLLFEDNVDYKADGDLHTFLKDNWDKEYKDWRYRISQRMNLHGSHVGLENFKSLMKMTGDSNIITETECGRMRIQESYMDWYEMENELPSQ